MTINKKAEKYYKQFKNIKRGEDTITVFTDNASEKLRNSVYKAHGDRLPTDWIFDKYQSILSAITEYDNNSEDDLQENRWEIVDCLVDVYTSDLTSWLNDSNYNVYYIDEAIQEYGPTEDGFKLLQLAQYKAIDDIFSYVYDLLCEGN